MRNQKVVITGLGAISSIGIGKESFWKALLAGKDGVRRIKNFDITEYHTKKAALVTQRLFSGRQQEINSVALFSIETIKMALEDAHIQIADLQNRFVNVYLGTTMGESQVFHRVVSETLGRRKKHLRSLVKRLPPNRMISQVFGELGLTGSGQVFLTACAAGNYAFSRGYDLIKTGKADLVIAGGAEVFSLEAFAGFNRMFAVASDCCRPFSKDRKGLILGEGAGILVMESEKSARKRGAHIYAEFLGYGLSCDAHRMIDPEPQGEGVVNAYRDLFRHCSLRPCDVDYINAHGTGTLANDQMETRAIKKIFGKRAKKIPVSSIKSMIGHCMGAASAIEAVASCLVLERGIIPATINYRQKDPECDLDYVPNKARKKKVNVLISNSFGFAGNNALCAMRRYNG